MPEEAVNNLVEDEPHGEGLDDEEALPKAYLVSETRYSGPTHDDVRRMLQDAVKEHENGRLRSLIDDRCEKGILTLIKEARKFALETFRTPIFDVMELKAFKAFFTREADVLLDDKMYKLSESQHFIQGLFCHLIKSPTFTVLVLSLVKKHTERAIASEAKFIQNIIREILVKEEVTPPLPLISRSPEPSKTS